MKKKREILQKLKRSRTKTFTGSATVSALSLASIHAIFMLQLLGRHICVCESPPGRHRLDCMLVAFPPHCHLVACPTCRPRAHTCARFMPSVGSDGDIYAARTCACQNEAHSASVGVEFPLVDLSFEIMSANFGGMSSPEAYTIRN